MKARQLLECTIDINDPVAELSAVISLVLQSHPGKQEDILRLLDQEIGIALAAFETKDIVPTETEK
ncbi:hypothetical protein [Paenibacillus sp. UMB4589-SE434]|uniref:hypothetical protein n=1 Tax=Paenibacillus sp. UMB4589-SE434 TaxID=3046314 RepID=UPI00254FE878|nr:hypothetical protein [Paenibacillus sp. UMB4589-SE434]MDK8182126.1 hypothetical protein [Paenibacillus sp. UMB4589-SE434]